MKSDSDTSVKHVDLNFNFGMAPPNYNYSVVNPPKGSARNQEMSQHHIVNELTPKIPDSKIQKPNYLNHNSAIGNASATNTRLSNNTNYAPSPTTYGIEGLARSKPSIANQYTPNNTSANNISVTSDSKLSKNPPGSSQGLRYVPNDVSKNNVYYIGQPNPNILRDYNSVNEQSSSFSKSNKSGSNLSNKNIKTEPSKGYEAPSYSQPSPNYTSVDRNPNNQNYNYSNFVLKNAGEPLSTAESKYQQSSSPYIGTGLAKKK